LVYVGGVGESKGSAIMMRASELVRQKFPSAQLILIGPPIDSGDDEKERNAAGHGAVRRIAWLPYDQMLAYLHVAHVGLALYQPGLHYPLLSRGNARKVFSYMQAGLPVVVSNFGEIGRVVREEGCGILVDSTQPGEVADAIIKILSEPPLANQMRARARQAIEEKYNWDLEERKMLSVYPFLGDKEFPA
jgi:glycosyltransferase involved in cell wall biosynthesis